MSSQDGLASAAKSRRDRSRKTSSLGTWTRVRTSESLRADDGFTLIEALVVIVLLSVLLIPFADVFVRVVAAAGFNGNRQDAAALASTVLSKLEALPYNNVGFSSTTLSTQAGSYTTPVSGTYYWDTDGDGSNFTGPEDVPPSGDGYDETLVQLSGGYLDPSFTLGSNGVAFAPITSRVLAGGSRYTVTTHIVYASSYVATCPGSLTTTSPLVEAFKRVFVSVTWRDGATPGGPLTADTVIYPGGQSAYSGPSYSTSNVPSAPTAVTATPTNTTGEITVSWKVPSPWPSSPQECFSIGWSDQNQASNSTGMLPNASLSGTVSAGSTVSYTVANLTQGDEYVFYVTAWSANGIESAESGDSGTALSPSGPLLTTVTVTGESPAAGLPYYGRPTGGTTVTLTGTGFSTAPGGTRVFFGANQGTSVTCSSTTSCTAVSPAGIGTVDVTARSAAGVSSPTLVADKFTYDPQVTGVSPNSGSASGGTSVTITGYNFVDGTTSLVFGPTNLATSVTCSSTTSCTAVSPAGTASAIPVDVTATTPGGSSTPIMADEFTYT